MPAGCDRQGLSAHCGEAAASSPSAGKGKGDLICVWLGYHIQALEKQNKFSYKIQLKLVSLCSEKPICGVGGMGSVLSLAKILVLV